MVRRDILGRADGYEQGGGYRGLFTLRATLIAFLIVGAYLAVCLVIERLFGNRVSTDLSRLAFAGAIAWMNGRVLLDPDYDGEARTAAERRRLRLWACLGLAFALLIAALPLLDLFALLPRRG